MDRSSGKAHFGLPTGHVTSRLSVFPVEVRFVPNFAIVAVFCRLRYVGIILLEWVLNFLRMNNYIRVRKVGISTSNLKIYTGTERRLPQAA